MTTQEKQELMSLLGTLGLLAILVAMSIPLYNGPFFTGTWHQYIFAAGALTMLLAQLFSPYKGSDPKLKRLFRLQTWAVLFFCAAAVLIFIKGTAMQDWIALTLAGAVVRVYTSWAIVARKKKLADINNGK